MLSTKARNIVLALISLCAAALIAIGVETTKGLLFEIRKSLADIEAAKAANKAAEAQTLDAINRLKGTIETAKVLHDVGRLQANATIVAGNRAAQAVEVAAARAADGLKEATGIQAHPDNAMYDSVTGPMFGEPAKQIQNLNERIVRLKREAHRGVDSKTRRVLSETERSERAAEAKVLDEELEMVKETSSKNVADAIGMFIGGGTGSSGGIFGSLFPSGNEKPVPRRILEEK